MSGAEQTPLRNPGAIAAELTRRDLAVEDAELAARKRQLARTAGLDLFSSLGKIKTKVGGERRDKLVVSTEPIPTDHDGITLSVHGEISPHAHDSGTNYDPIDGMQPNYTNPESGKIEILL